MSQEQKKRKIARGQYCCVVGCYKNERNNGGPGGLKFHRFPANPERQNAWLRAMKRADWQPKKSKFSAIVFLLSFLA